MQIRPENPGLAQADLVAAHAHTLAAGLSKPEIAGLIQGLNAADAVTLLDVASSDMGKLAQILQAGDSQFRPSAPTLTNPAAQVNPSAALNPLSPTTQTRPVDQPLLMNQTAPVNRPESVERPEVVNPPGSANQAVIQPNVANQPVVVNQPLASNRSESVIQPEVVSHAPPLTNAERLITLTALSNQLNAANQSVPVNRPEMIDLAQLVHPAALANQPHTAVLAAMFNAQVKLSQAEQTVEQSGGRKLPDWETSPQILLQIGHRLYNAGGYGNYIRASAVADTIQSAYWGATLIHDQISLATRASLLGKDGYPGSLPFPGLSLSKLSAGLSRLWRRAPLLVLLVGWLAIGICGGLLFKSFGFEFWALGFLALVGFGFYSTIRK